MCYRSKPNENHIGLTPSYREYSTDKQRELPSMALSNTKTPPLGFQDLISPDGVALGMWVSMSDPACAEIAAAVGFDWVLIDMEHTTNDLSTVLHLCRSISSSQTQVIVRPPSNNYETIKRLLDASVRTLLIPFIQSAQDAEQAIHNTLYPPNGIRGFTSTSRANNYGLNTDYLKEADQNIKVIVQIETKRAFEEAEQILKVQHLGGVFVGIADLAMDLGLPGQATHPEVVGMAKHIARLARYAGVPCGTLVSDLEVQKALVEEGMSFIAIGGDVRLLAQAMQSAFSRVTTSLN